MSHSVRNSSRAIDDRAATWVGRRDAGLTPAEAAELADWQQADPRHAVALKRFESVWAEADRPRNHGTAEVVYRRLAERARRRRHRRTLFGAGLAACVMIGGGFWASMREGGVESASAAHTTLLGPEQRILPDASVAEYTPGTTLTVDFSGNTRRVTFAHGDAHFRVIKNTERPFIVTAGGFTIRAVGTAFAVHVGRASTAVVVTAGRVAVNAETTPPPPSAAATPLAFVDAGQGIDMRRAQPGAAPVVVEIPTAEMTERLAWRQRRVEFSSAPLAEVIAIVNRHNRLQFSIEGHALARVPLSGVFRLEDPEELARLLESNFAVTVTRPSPNHILLQRQ